MVTEEPFKKETSRFAHTYTTILFKRTFFLQSTEVYIWMSLKSPLIYLIAIYYLNKMRLKCIFIYTLLLCVVSYHDSNQFVRSSDPFGSVLSFR